MSTRERSERAGKEELEAEVALVRADNRRLREGLWAIVEAEVEQKAKDIARAALSPPTDSEEWVCPICRTAMCGYAEHRFAPTDSEGFKHTMKGDPDEDEGCCPLCPHLPDPAPTDSEGK